MAKSPKTNSTPAAKATLPAEVAERFDVAPGVLHRFASAEFGEIILSEVTMELAERLAQSGFLIAKES